MIVYASLMTAFAASTFGFAAYAARPKVSRELEPAPPVRLLTDPASHAEEMAELRRQNAQNKALLTDTFK